MTEDPADGEIESLDKLERVLDRLGRRQRGVIVLQVASLCVLMLFDLGLIWLEGGREAPRDTAMVLGLVIVGLGVCGTRVTDWQYLRKRDAREIRLMREVEEALPLVAAIPASSAATRPTARTPPFTSKPLG